MPWYQGIELFLALRRNGKEAYLFNYNGEFHGLRRRADQTDYAVRMQQFFDHFLKGAPKPEWMEKGIPFIEREQEKTRFQKALTDVGTLGETSVLALSEDWNGKTRRGPTSRWIPVSTP